jgi:hypothetical protein
MSSNLLVYPETQGLTTTIVMTTAPRTLMRVHTHQVHRGHSQGCTPSYDRRVRRRRLYNRTLHQDSCHDVRRDLLREWSGDNDGCLQEKALIAGDSRHGTPRPNLTLCHVVCLKPAFQLESARCLKLARHGRQHQEAVLVNQARSLRPPVTSQRDSDLKTDSTVRLGSNRA